MNISMRNKTDVTKDIFLFVIYLCISKALFAGMGWSYITHELLHNHHNIFAFSLDFGRHHFAYIGFCQIVWWWHNRLNPVSTSEQIPQKVPIASVKEKRNITTSSELDITLETRSINEKILGCNKPRCIVCVTSY
jgi:hypothetical protein